ncbi:MAG TPA: prepilin-type N-terminal cleavage/methylation domain-containing protein [Candidatus Rifleibacterium sp.]|nr:prepilin-type N-terminal cleavage/methylation domain-containing protein [Candidatus Rifleibacterium sp.]HPT44825.1 prepilin-type N-terminal cleavage/methylation domain-containing protein [Candidatus Rifleibacterium sp.]
MKQRQQGVTLIEVAIGSFIISLLMASVMNLFGAGMRGSTKGMAHLTNMEAAAVLMSQIEYDLLRAVKLLDPAPGASDKVARWEILTDSGNGTIIYNLLDNGIEREFDGTSDDNKHIYCKGLDVKLAFSHVTFAASPGAGNKAGMWVEISVATPKKGGSSEEFKMKRLILCRNIAAL